MADAKRHWALGTVPMTELRAWLAEPSGHSFFEPEGYVRMGFPEELIRSVTKVHRSNRKDPMSQIRNRYGRVLPALVAVRELDLLWRLAGELGADTNEAERKLGRGTQARCLGTAILAVLDRR